MNLKARLKRLEGECPCESCPTYAVVPPGAPYAAPGCPRCGAKPAHPKVYLFDPATPAASDLVPS